MRVFIVFTLLMQFFVLDLVSAAKVDSQKEGLLLFTEGSKKEIFVNGKAMNTLKNLELAPGDYQLETKESELKLKWGSILKIKLYENSKILLEIKKGASPEINHQKGKVKIILDGASVNYQIEKLFLFPLASGEFVAELSAKDHVAKFSSLQSDQKIQIVEDDRVQLLKEGFSLEMTPEWSDGEMVYDFLLNNKKIPRLHAVQSPIPPQDLQKSTTAEWKFVIEKKKVKKPTKKEDLTQEQLEQKINQVKFSKIICRNPSAAYGECAWEKEKNKCARYTCNLNGVWSQKTEFNLVAECPAKRQTKSCEWLR